MDNFTPGPWVITTNFDYWVETERGDPVALCGDVTWDDACEQQSTWEANARLIASAPDLLSALRTARDRLAMMLRPDDPRNDDAFRLVDDTIRRVEGET